MAGFIEWIKENATVAFIPTAIFASMVIKAEPENMLVGLCSLFAVSFMITCFIRLISTTIHNLR